MSRNRVWYTDMNVLAVDVSTAFRATCSSAWAYKEFLKGTMTGSNGPEGPPLSSSFWVVAGSGDGVTSAMDGIDRTGTGSFDASKWVRGAAHTNVHTWVALRNQSSSMHVLLSIVGATDASCISIYGATTAFTTTNTGSNARPTSTTEWVGFGRDAVTNGAPTDINQFTDGLAVPYRFHMCRDANGEHYFAASKNSSNIFQTLYMFASRIKAPVSDLAKYSIVWAYSSTGVVGTGATSFAGSAPMGRNIGNSAQEKQVIPLFSVGGSGNNSVFNNSFATVDADGKANLFEVPVLALSSFAYRGILPDVHVVIPYVTAGLTIPATGSVERVGFSGWTAPFSVAPLL